MPGLHVMARGQHVHTPELAGDGTCSTQAVTVVVATSVAVVVSSFAVFVASVIVLVAVVAGLSVAKASIFPSTLSTSSSSA